MYSPGDRVNLFWSDIHCATGTVKDSSIENDMISKIEIDTIFQETIDGITQCAKQAELSGGNTVAWLYREIDTVCEIQKKKIKPDKKIESRNCIKLDCRSKFSSDDQEKLRSEYWNKDSMEEKNLFHFKMNNPRYRGI